MLNPILRSVARFGIFEVNLRTRELRKHGLHMNLPGQPFTILAVLVENRGEIVTREQLKKKLWPADTFVDFEHGLNSAIKKLREALNDSADNPRYIETLPRLGYRFIAPAQYGPSLETPAVAPALLPERKPAEAAVPAAAGRKRTKIWALTAAFAVGLLAIAGAYLMRWRSRPALTEADRVLVSDFANTTGEPVFDDTLKQAVSVELGQSPFFNILSDAKVNSTLRLMMKPVNERLTPEVSQEVCQRAGGKAYVAGSIASLGKEYVIGLNAVNCETGDVLAQEQAAADSKEHVLKALGQTTTALREKLGESLASIRKFDTPIDEATTPSLDALRSLSVGKKIQQEKGNAAAIPYFKRAIDLDPNFAAAYAALGTSYSNLREAGLASENLRRAYELRGRVSDRERFRFSAYYYHLVTGEIEKAIETYQLWAQAYPRDNVPLSNLGVAYGYLGQYDQAVKAIQEDIQLNPGSSVGYTNLVSDYMALNRTSDAKATYQQAMSRNLDNPYLHLNSYGVAFLEGDAAEMQRQTEWAVGQPQGENLLLSAQSDTEAYFGRSARAREFSQRAANSARTSNQPGTAVEWQMNAALRDAEFGSSTEARQQISAILKAPPNREVQILAALALARAGDSKRAEQLADDLAQRFPLDTAINSYWLPTIRASIEMNRREPKKAIEILKAALPHELGNPLPQAELGAFLYPVYVRSQAYLMLGQGKEAAGEFQKLLDHRGITVNCPFGALAHLGLARSYVLQDDTVKSRAAYQDFLALWKDADPDIPILIAAKSEYAKLK
jgi:DNA-binding winged helix-turn-helix (wHTH) protein/predicted Zn-dependent protease